MEVGGIETLIREFISRLNGDGYLPSACVFKGGGSLEKGLVSEGIQVFDLEKKEGIDIALIYKLRRLFRENDIRILHTHNYSAWLYGVLASTGLDRLRHIHTEHSNVSKSRRAWAEKTLGFFTDRIVCVSGDVKRSMIERQGISEKRLAVIYNGVDTDRFSPSPEKRSLCRKQLGIGGDVPVAGIVARLHPVKNHASLLNAFSIIRRSISGAVLLIVGDGELKGDLLNRTREMGLEGQVIFSGERQDIPELLNAMDVFVLPSVSEGHNMSLIEAMSTGLPAVATGVGGNREVVSDGITGYLVPSNTPTELADKIMCLMKGPGHATEMGKKAREMVIDKFSVRKMMEDYKAVYWQMHFGN